MSLQNLISHIKKGRKFLITTHTSMEGDALGSEIAFYKLLKRIGKDAMIINDDAIPYEYGFLPGLKCVKRFKSNLKDSNFDSFVILDCSDISRCGRAATLCRKGRRSINIDHHITNEYFADVNWVERNVSSVSEMIYMLYKKMGVGFNRDIATLLYVGMMTDTGSFRYSNTGRLTHQAAAELMKYGLDIQQLYRVIYDNVPLQARRLINKVCSAMQCDASGKIAWIKVRRNLIRQQKFNFDFNEHLLDFMRSIREVEVAVLFKENLKNQDEIRVNLRSKGKVDVSKIALFFGGGGHAAASGCTVQGSIDEVSKRVLKKIKASL